MKKLILSIIIILFFGLIHHPVNGQTPSSSPTLTVTPINLTDKLEKIKILKDKVATKVAELRNNEKKALTGSVKSTAKTNFNFAVGTNDITANLSEDTVYYSFDNNGGRVDSNFTKIKEGTLVTVFGYFDNSNQSIDAKYVYINPTLPLHLVGKITDLDRQNFTVTIKTADMTQWIIDIETFTKAQIYTKDAGLVKSGFSKLLPGDLVHITGTPNAKEKNRSSAIRILVLRDFSSSTSSPSPASTPITSPRP